MPARRIAIVVAMAGLTPAFAAKQVLCHDGGALLLLANTRSRHALSLSER